MIVEAVGEPWRATRRSRSSCAGRVAPRRAAAAQRLRRRRRSSGSRADDGILLDGQGLVRVPKTGPLALDADYDPDMLRHVAILKLGDDEARAIAGDAELESLASLGVPEVVVTFGLEGSLVLARGHRDPCSRTRRATPTRPVPATRSRPRTSPRAPTACAGRRRRDVRPRSSPRS